MRDDRQAVCARLHKLWARNGRPSHRELVRILLRDHDVEVSNTTVSAYLKGGPGVPEPAAMNIDLIVGLAAIFGTTPAAISPTVARRAASERGRLERRLAFLSTYAPLERDTFRPHSGDSGEYPLPRRRELARHR